MSQNLFYLHVLLFAAVKEGLLLHNLCHQLSSTLIWIIMFKRECSLTDKILSQSIYLGVSSQNQNRL